VKIRILRSARRDLVEGYRFYERRRAGLGAYFRESLLEDIDRLAISAGFHSIVHGKHRKIASRFPYSIFYLRDEDGIRVYAVLDDRRDPEWISDRLN
jgi:plasmid stabilization system protein ParE